MPACQLANTPAVKSAIATELETLFGARVDAKIGQFTVAGMGDAFDFIGGDPVDDIVCKDTGEINADMVYSDIRVTAVRFQ